jgi:hypothetical protein
LRYKLKYSTEGIKQKCEIVFHSRISSTSKNETDQTLHTSNVSNPVITTETFICDLNTVCTQILRDIEHITNFTSHSRPRPCKNKSLWMENSVAY